MLGSSVDSSLWRCRRLRLRGRGDWLWSGVRRLSGRRMSLGLRYMCRGGGLSRFLGDRFSVRSMVGSFGLGRRRRGRSGIAALGGVTQELHRCFVDGAHVALDRHAELGQLVDHVFAGQAQLFCKFVDSHRVIPNPSSLSPSCRPVLRRLPGCLVLSPLSRMFLLP